MFRKSLVTFQAQEWPFRKSADQQNIVVNRFPQAVEGDIGAGRNTGNYSVNSNGPDIHVDQDLVISACPHKLNLPQTQPEERQSKLTLETNWLSAKARNAQEPPEANNTYQPTN